jgi:hypothetical protein
MSGTSSQINGLGNDSSYMQTRQVVNSLTNLDVVGEEMNEVLARLCGVCVRLGHRFVSSMS